MPIIPTLISWFTVKRLNQIDLFKKYPIEAQREVFFELITAAKNTVWGKKYDYQSIKTTKEFQERVPISSYEDLSEYIDRVREGEQNVLWPSKIQWFAISSGTTNDKSKYIPVITET